MLLQNGHVFNPIKNKKETTTETIERAADIAQKVKTTYAKPIDPSLILRVKMMQGKN